MWIDMIDFPLASKAFLGRLKQVFATGFNVSLCDICVTLVLLSYWNFFCPAVFGNRSGDLWHLEVVQCRTFGLGGLLLSAAGSRQRHSTSFDCKQQRIPRPVLVMEAVVVFPFFGFILVRVQSGPVWFSSVLRVLHHLDRNWKDDAAPTKAFGQPLGWDVSFENGPEFKTWWRYRWKNVNGWFLLRWKSQWKQITHVLSSALSYLSSALRGACGRSCLRRRCSALRPVRLKRFCADISLCRRQDQLCTKYRRWGWVFSGPSAQTFSFRLRSFCPYWSGSSAESLRSFIFESRSRAPAFYIRVYMDKFLWNVRPEFIWRGSAWVEWTLVLNSVAWGPCDIWLSQLVNVSNTWCAVDIQLWQRLWIGNA